jgi:hypothetical protein
MATDSADLIERITETYSLINLSLSFRAEAAAPEYAWGCCAQWISDGESNIDGRGVVSSYGADPIAALLACAGLIAVKQDGPLPVRLPLQVAA